MNTAIITIFLLFHPQPLASLAKNVMIVGPIAFEHAYKDIVPPRKVGPVQVKR
jgi:hypothetical protein